VARDRSERTAVTQYFRHLCPVYGSESTFRRLIQAIRLTYALSETPFDVRLPSGHACKLRRLLDVFGIELKEADDTAPPLPGISVEHNVDGGPVSRFGRIERPLIFAHGMADHLDAVAQSASSPGQFRWTTA